jgi:hypothetical protein
MGRRPMQDESEKELLSQLGQKLDQVIALLAIQGRNPDEQIRILYEFGYDSTYIGRVLGRDPSAIRHVKRSLARKRSRTGNRRASSR